MSSEALKKNENRFWLNAIYRIPLGSSMLKLIRKEIARRKKLSAIDLDISTNFDDKQTALIVCSGTRNEPKNTSDTARLVDINDQLDELSSMAVRWRHARSLGNTPLSLRADILTLCRDCLGYEDFVALSDDMTTVAIDGFGDMPIDWHKGLHQSAFEAACDVFDRHLYQPDMKDDMKADYAEFEKLRKAIDGHPRIAGSIALTNVGESSPERKGVHSGP